MIMTFLALTANGEEIYQEDFSKYSSGKPDSSRRSIDMTVYPEIKHALRLDTGKSWSSSTFDAGSADMLEVDYYMKAETDTVRIRSLFVMDNTGKPMVAVVVSQGQFEYGSLGAWQKVAQVKYGEWHHLRYAIHIWTGSYDIYIDDMTKPKASRIKYHSSDFGTPARLWTECNETEPSVSYFGKISVRTKTSPEFPPLEWSGYPHYIAGVNKTAMPPKLDGKGDSECWKNTPALQYDNEGSDIKENSFVKLLWDDQNLYLFFSAQAADMEKRNNGETRHDGKVWRDDCLEIFIDPNLTRKNYYHLAANSVGGMYDSLTKGDGPHDSAWESSWKTAVSKGKDRWTLEAAIPFKDLGVTPKTGDVWGLNACRENPATYASIVSAWRPLQSFHTPEMFGKIVFVDSEYLNTPRKAQVKNLCERLYNGDNLLKETICNVTTVMEGENKDYFRKACDDLDKKIVEYEKVHASVEGFAGFYKSSVKARELLENSRKLRSDAERMQRFFMGPGCVGRKYMICIESTMNKIPGDNYSGSSETTAELQLAGRERGSFQAVLLAKPGLSMTGVALKSSEFKDKNGKVLSGAKIESFMVDYVTTAKPVTAQFQKKIADVLWPGKEFKFKNPLSSIPLWFDVYLPPNSAVGKYNAVITVTPDGCESVDIPVTLKALPFSLPLKASLETGFGDGCSGDWVEGYYRGKLPQDKRYEYFQFILDHHLDTGLYGDDMSEKELLWASERGKGMIFLSIHRLKESEQYYRDIIRKFDGKLKPVFFGWDEVLSTKNEKLINKMKADFKTAKEKFPDVPRLNTAVIDERLFGYVDIWCPLFDAFKKDAAMERVAKGERVWWYTTNYPLKPYANFNLDSPGIDPRIIPWMNWKLGISGLLYWSLNREWLTNYQEAERITDKQKAERVLEWMTPEVQEKIKKGLRWPDVPWIPYFRPCDDTNGTPCLTSGGGNLMYPGPNFQPIPSIRLKNLRDGLQDYEYFVILKNNLEELKKRNGNKELITHAEKALKLDNVVGGATDYTQNPLLLLQAKAELSDLIVQTQNELNK